MALEDQFKNALASWASGVSVVTTQANGLLYGLTVSSFSSVSLHPPLILVCLNKLNRLDDMIRESGRFAVSILRRDQEEASRYFATPGREPTRDFVEIAGEWTEWDVPIVHDALAHVVCDLHDTIDAGDHIVVLGKVLDARASDGEPLLYYNRGYRRVATD